MCACGRGKKEGVIEIRDRLVSAKRRNRICERKARSNANEHKGKGVGSAAHTHVIGRSSFFCRIILAAEFSSVERHEMSRIKTVKLLIIIPDKLERTSNCWRVCAKPLLKLGWSGICA